MAQIKPLTPDLQKIANEELNEVPSRISEDLQALKQWIAQQPHLKARTDDQFLIQFLRGCKYSLEKAKEKIDRLYMLKTKFPEFFGVTDLTDVKFREHFRLGCFVPLPRPLNDNGPRIVVIRVRYKVAEHPIDEVYSSFNVMHEILLLDDPYACICGIVYINDLSNITTGHMLQATPSFIKKYATYFEKALPLRIKSVCYINISSAAEQMFKMILSFFSEKLKQRFHICGKDLDTLPKEIPRRYLPIDYGGENGLLDDVVMEYEKKFDEYRDFFLENVQYGTNEALRPGKPIDFDTMFGMGGSFRKLDVD